MKIFPVPFHTYIIFVIGIVVYIFTLLLINGETFNLYSDNKFPCDAYFNFWKNMTSEQRFFLTETYYQFYINLKEKILHIQNNSINENISINATFLNSDHLTYKRQYEKVPFILVSFIPLNKQFNKKLLICSHFDGHNLTSGGTAYDDAIHVVSMLGTMEALSQNNFDINTQIDFLFDGAEEYGLVGARQYSNYLKKNNITENYDYLNLESMGGAPPYGFVIKNIEGNYRIQKALSFTRGSILLASNLFYDSGIVSSSSDHVVFNGDGWLGGVNVFLGKGSVYHTKYDKIDDKKSKEHLKMAGAQLLDFVLNYESEGINSNSVGYGIAPICVVLPSLVLYILIPIFFIISVIAIIINERKNKKEFFFDLLMQFICFMIVLAIFLIIGLLVYLINSNSVSDSQIFAILISFMGLFLFIIFHRILKIKKWSRFRLVFNSLLMMLLITTDLSLPLLALNILSTVFYFFENKIIKYISAFFQYLVMSLFFAFDIQVAMQYTTRLSDISGNIIIFSLYFIFSYHLAVSPLDLYEIPEDEKILDLIKGLFKKEKNINRSLNDSEENEAFYSIVDELVDEVESKSTLSSIKLKNKYCNKKIIPVYLLLFYIIYILTLILIIFFKPSPFSKSYTVRGTFFNIYKDSQNSSMIFLPNYNGYNYAQKHIKDSKYKSKFREEDITNYINEEYKGKAFVVDSNEFLSENNGNKCDFTMLPLSEIITISNHTISDRDNKEYNFTFNFNIKNTSCIDSVYLYINCDKCILKVNNLDYQYKDSGVGDKNSLLIRIGKNEINNSIMPDFITKSNFILNTNKFQYNIYLNTMKNSKDYLTFLESFGEATCNARSSHISDTIFKYEGSYPPH